MKCNCLVEINSIQFKKKKSDLFFVLLFTSRILHTFGCNFVYSMPRFIGYGRA